MYCSIPTKTALDDIETVCKYIADEKSKTGGVHSFLIIAPTGTGKELIARHIAKKIRPNNTYVTFNSSTLSETLYLGHLFGAKKGAYTGASDDKEGLIGKANDGALFLDEFLEGSEYLQKELQGSLLRLVEHGEYYRLGDPDKKDANLVLICASNIGDSINGLEELISDDRRPIRPDLFARFGFKFDFHRLKDRPIEILPTFVHYLFKEMRMSEDEEIELSVNAIKLLLHHQFPYNFRTIKQAAERLAIMFGEKKQLITSKLMKQALGISIQAELGSEETKTVCIRLLFGQSCTQNLVFEYQPFDWESINRNEARFIRAYNCDADNDLRFDCENGSKTFKEWIEFIVKSCCFLNTSAEHIDRVVQISIGSENFQDSDKKAIKVFLYKLIEFMDRAIKRRKVKEKSRDILKLLFANAKKMKKGFDEWSTSKQKRKYFEEYNKFAQYIWNLELNNSSAEDVKYVKYFAIWLLTGSYVGPTLSDQASEE
jgi:hypothetical protein